MEGTRSYGIGVAGSRTAAGIHVIECEQPDRKARRGKGKSDALDAHHAVLLAVRDDRDQLPAPRTDGDREAVRILLGARRDLNDSATAQTNRLRALLLAGCSTDGSGPGDDTDRALARRALPTTVLASVARRRLPAGATRMQAVRHAEIRRLAVALVTGVAALKVNMAPCAGSFRTSRRDS